MGEAVAMTVKTIEEIGKRKYEEFKRARVIDVTQKLEDTITKKKACSFQAVEHRGTIFEILMKGFET